MIAMNEIMLPSAEEERAPQDGFREYPLFLLVIDCTAIAQPIGVIVGVVFRSNTCCLHDSCGNLHSLIP